MAPSFNGWEKLICPYFAETTRRALGRYLEEQGFAEKRLTGIGGLVFCRLDVFLEVSYELETTPQSLTMVLGIGDRIYGADGHVCGVPYWYLLPRDRSEHQAGAMGFKSEAGLDALTARLRNDFLEPYARPLWLDVERLEKIIQKFRSEYSC